MSDLTFRPNMSRRGTTIPNRYRGGLSSQTDRNTIHQPVCITIRRSWTGGRWGAMFPSLEPMLVSGLVEIPRNALCRGTAKLQGERPIQIGSFALGGITGKHHSRGAVGGYDTDGTGGYSFPDRGSVMPRRLPLTWDIRGQQRTISTDVGGSMLAADLG